jgi:hypothetical protein
MATTLNRGARWPLHGRRSYRWAVMFRWMMAMDRFIEDVKVP